MKYLAIPMEGYYLIVSDEKPKKGDWHLEKELVVNKFPTYLTDLSECKKIIGIESKAADKYPELPFFDAAWEENVEKLAEEYVDDNSGDKWIDRGLRDGFVYGYNAAKAKYGFTCEDMELALWDLLTEYESLDREDRVNGKIISKFLQSFKKPKVYEVTIETEGICCSPLSGGINHHGDCDKCEQVIMQPKIIDNRIKILTWNKN